MKTRLLVAVALATVTHSAQAQSRNAASPPPPARTEEPSKGRGAVINLRPKFKVGQVIRLKMDMRSSGKQTTASTPGLPATDASQSMSQEITLSLKVKETDPAAGTKLDLVYDSFKISMKTPDGQDVTFDTSSKKKDDPLADLLAPLAGLTMAVTMDKDGNITSVDSGEGGDLSSMLGGAGGLSQFTGADVVKNLFGPVMTTRKGAGEARVGESWTNDDVIDAPWGKMKLSTTQTLASHRGSLATIDLRGKFDLMPTSSTSPAPTIRDSLYTGKTLWNTETGMLDEMTMKQHLVVDQGQKGRSTHDMDVKVVRLSK